MFHFCHFMENIAEGTTDSNIQRFYLRNCLKLSHQSNIGNTKTQSVKDRYIFKQLLKSKILRLCQMSDGQQHKVFQSRKQNVWLLYLIQCLFFYRNIRHILSFGTKISLRNCVIAIFVIKIMADLVSSRLMIQVYVTNIQDIWTQNCVLNVQTKMSTHRGYLQLVLGTE